MTSLRETKNRIKSVKSTEKITKAMKMVAASKLRRAQEAVLKPRAYSLMLRELMSSLAARAELGYEEPHPLLLDRPHKEKALVLALSSDRGLCGALNSSVVRATQKFLLEQNKNFAQIEVSTIGKKGFEGLARLGVTISKHYESKSKFYDLPMATMIANEICERYLAHEIDAVYFIYNEFKSAITQTVIIEQFLPVPKVEHDPGHTPIDYIYEPNYHDLLSLLIPRHFAGRLYQCFLESYASEQGARMTAMDNATRNAKEMTDRLTLEYNRARQAAITKELVEIIGGAEAL